MNQPIFHPGPEQPSPEQRLLLLDDTKWESFIEQCARQLMTEGHYTQVIRMGGAGDKGRDVCGYSEQLPSEETWDLYQAKYYTDTLSPSSFAPELAKFLSCVFAKDYTRPRNYFICALKVGPALHDLVLNPEKFKAWTLSTRKTLRRKSCLMRALRTASTPGLLHAKSLGKSSSWRMKNRTPIPCQSCATPSLLAQATRRVADASSLFSKHPISPVF